MPKRPQKARPDRRYKNPDDAPPIVSEKRLTFFLPQDVFTQLRRHTGYFQIANAEADIKGDEAFPETPSALVREAIVFWLDQFPPVQERSRTPKEWEQRLKELAKALSSR